MRLLLVSVLFLAAAGCLVEAPGKSRVKARQVEAPALEVRNGAVLGGRVRIVGARFAPGRLRPGDAIQASLAFEVLAPLEKDYEVFVHLDGAFAGRARVNADHAPRSPTSSWKVGDVVRDDFTLVLPQTSTATQVEVWAGLWDPAEEEDGRARLPVSNPEDVRHDGRGRVFLATLPVGD